ncbi:MAG TPA: hypothetical protein VFM33_13945 [Aquabacterium sp.]|nr:hypothetical protein [Aquabacterium sp.]
MTHLSSEAERLADRLPFVDESDVAKIAALLRRIPELEADAAIHKARLFEALESEPTLKAAEEQVNDCLRRPTFMDMSKLLDVASANFTERKRVEAERDRLRAIVEGRAAGCQCGDDDVCKIVKERDQLRAELEKVRWQPIETAPQDMTECVVVRWVDSDGQEHQDFDYTEDGCWMRWHDHAEHAEAIGGHGVNYTPPYQHWMPPPPPPTTQGSEE